MQNIKLDTMASISTSDSALISVADSHGRSENVRFLPGKVTTLEFDEQEKIQLRQSNKLPKVWTVNENEEFGNLVTLKDVYDLIVEGEEHLWKQ